MRIRRTTTGRLRAEPQPTPAYVRPQVESRGGWIIDHGQKRISVDYGYTLVRQDLHEVLMALDDLEPFPPNVPYITESVHP